MTTKTGRRNEKSSKTVMNKTKKSDGDGMKHPKHKLQKKELLIGSGIAVLALSAILIVAGLTLPRNISASALINSYAKNAGYIEAIIEADDPDGIVGNPHMYISKSSWEDNRLKDIVEPHAGTIEVFRNSNDAELREWYLDKISEACTKHIAAAKYGKDLHEQVCNSLGYGTTYRNQTVIVRLSRSLTENQVSEYKSEFNSLIKKFKITETDVPSDDELSELKKQDEEKIEQTMSQQENALINNLDGLASDMDSNVDNTLSESNPNESKLTDLQDSLAYLKTIPYFSDKIATWEQKINVLSEKIAQNKAEEARRAEEEERTRKAAKTRTFSAGKYIVGRDIDSGTYNLTAINGSGNLFVHDILGSSTINEMMSPSGGRLYLTNYKNAYLGSGYEIEITSTLVVKFESI